MAANTLFASVESLKGKLICGIDEVGRGPLAGPVVAAAVILPEGFFHEDIVDSKRLKSHKIKEVARLIYREAVSTSIGIKDASYIDEKDILTATFMAMYEAFLSLNVKPDLILIDGNLKNPYITDTPQISLIKGESKSLAIAAASIIAKDYRDRLMEDYGTLYPQYKFEKHKGYGTREHLELLRKYGPSPIHRKSFCHVKEALNTRGLL